MLANSLAEKSNFEIIVLEKGNRQAPLLEGNLYVADKPNLNFTRGEGAGGTSNLWHSGFIRMPLASAWAYELIEAQGWYEKAIALTSAILPDRSSNNKPLDVDEIYYPNQRFKPILQSSISIEFGVDKTKIDPIKKCISYCCSGEDRVKSYDILVICAGGIGTPSLLKNSLNRQHFKNPLIGKNLTDHISSMPMRLKLKNRQVMRFSTRFARGISRKGWVHQDLQSGLQQILYLRPAMNINLQQHTQELKKQLIGFWGAKNKLSAVFKLLSSFDILLEILANKIPLPMPVKYLAVNIVSEQEPSNKNSVGYDGNELYVNWHFNEVERKAIINTCHKFLQETNLDISEFTIEQADNISYTVGCHHSGTARLGRDPKSSVVNLDLKMHGFNDVYICDGSVLPSTAYANTGLSIIALAARLANHITSDTK